MKIVDLEKKSNLKDSAEETTKLALSVVICTKNEEDKIEKCLESVYHWADEILLIDDESTDKTVQIAQQYCDKVYYRKMDMEGVHRNWAYDQAKNDWVLSLDADEIMTSGLKDEIAKTLAHTEFDVFSLPRKNFIGSYWLKYGGQYPSAQLKLFKKQCFRYEETTVHPVSFVTGKIGHLSGDIIHHSYKDFEHFLAKLNSQTSLEAKKWIKDNRKMSFGRALWRTMDRFPRTFLMKRGYKDGFMGFMVAFFASLYQVMSYAKYWEIKNLNKEK